MIDLETIIIYLFIYIVEAFILWWYGSNLLAPKYSKKHEAIILVSGYAILFIASFAEFAWLNTLLFTIINFILLLILYEVKWGSALFHSMIITCIMGLSEVAIIGLFSQFNENFIYFHSNIPLLVFITVLSKFLFFIGVRVVVALIPCSITKDKSIGSTNITSLLLNIIPFASIYIIITLFAILLDVSISKHFRYMLSSCAALLLLINVLIFYIYHYTQQKNKEFTEIQLLLQKENDMSEYYKTLFDQNENQQILIHDIRNHLLSINKLNEQNKREEINRYLDSLLKSSALQKSVHVSDNELLNSLLCHYMKVAQNKNISLKVDARKKLLQNMDYADLTSLFCNLLDNAIEACTDVPDSYIEISITSKQKTNITLINIINTCRTRPDFNKYGHPISRKKNKWKHGLGLKSVNRIVNKYDGDMKMYFDEEKLTFHTIIMLR